MRKGLLRDVHSRQHTEDTSATRSACPTFPSGRAHELSRRKRGLYSMSLENAASGRGLPQPRSCAPAPGRASRLALPVPPGLPSRAFPVPTCPPQELHLREKNKTKTRTPFSLLPSSVTSPSALVSCSGSLAPAQSPLLCPVALPSAASWSGLPVEPPALRPHSSPTETQASVPPCPPRAPPVTRPAFMTHILVPAAFWPSKGHPAITRPFSEFPLLVTLSPALSDSPSDVGMDTPTPEASVSTGTPSRCKGPPCAVSPDPALRLMHSQPCAHVSRCCSAHSF